MRKTPHIRYFALAAMALGLAPVAAFAGVSADEAAKLKSTLTPLGGEKASNADGSIPAWSGGLVDPNYKPTNGRRDNLFVTDKPLFSITAANVNQYADKLSEGTKVLFAKYPDFRVDVYKSERTAAAPQWVYDNTYQNAISGKMAEGSAGLMPMGVYGGTPFPIPKDGQEVMWNHLLAWRGADWKWHMNAYLLTSSGQRVLTVEGNADQQMPYYDKTKRAMDDPEGRYWSVRLINAGPPIRAGEGIVGGSAINSEKDAAWVYLTGQRRVRKLPNPCCDTPTPASAGVMSFDELQVFTGRLNRFDWTLVGKKEMYVPYNSNVSLSGTDAEFLGKSFVNPDKLRWELHRVWIVDAALREGQRHVAPKGRYYVDEDSWNAMLGERWDSNGQLWKVLFQAPFAAPDIPAQVANMVFGYYDVISGTAFISGILNNFTPQYEIVDHFPATNFTADALAGESIR